MGLFDSYDPQDFADRGGLVGRLLSLRPDLAQDQQGDEHSASDSQVLGPPWLTSAISANAPGAAVSASRGNIRLAQDAQALPIRLMSPDPLFVQPRLDSFPAYPPFTQADPLPRDMSLGGGRLALGLAAALASRKSSELLGGMPQPIAPVFPEPPVAPVPPQTPSMPPPATPVPPQEPSMPPYPTSVPPQLDPMPPEPTPAPEPTPTPSSSDDLQDALGPEWQGLENFINNTRDNGPGISEPESEAEKAERCRKQEIAAIKYCSEVRRDDNRNMLAGSRDFEECKKAFLDKDCGGYDPRDPKYFFPPYSRRIKKGRGSRLHR